MKKIVFILLGLLLFVGIWCFFYLYPADTQRKSLFTFLIVSFSLPIVYSLLYQKAYPVQTVLVFSIVEILLYKLTVFQTEAFQLRSFFIFINVLLGSILVLLGEFVGKIVTKLLSPMQSYFHSKRLKLSIPVLSGIICFIIGYFLITTGLYKLAILA